jgi:hypothetical protein
MTLFDLDAAKAHFRVDGYLRCDNVFDHLLIDEANCEFDRLLSITGDQRIVVLEKSGSGRSDPEKSLIRIENPHVGSSAYSKIVRNRDLGEIVAKVLDAEFVQVFFAHVTSIPSIFDTTAKVGWHQEEQYPDFISGSFPTVWIPLCDIGERSSPLRYVSGSHVLDVFPERGITSGLTHDEQKRNIMLGLGMKEWREVAMIGKKGMCSFHHSRLIHGTAPNSSEVQRRALVMHLRTEKNEFSDSKSAFYQQYARVHINDEEMSPIIWGTRPFVN